MRWHWISCTLLLALGAACGRAAALPPDRAAVRARDASGWSDNELLPALYGHGEWLDDVWGATPAAADAQSEAAVPRERGFASVQVNVNAAGQNIVGDAANEPSLGVDPRYPSRMAIGWRQFDTINSNFRQAGAAYTRDGGRTWRSVGPLDAGVFRSDPVLRVNSLGRFYYFSLKFVSSVYSCQYFVSNDGGATWTGPQTGFGGDKAWVAIDRTFGPGRDNFYALWDRAGCCGSRTFTRMVASDQRFEAPTTVPELPQWGTLDVGPTGQVFAAGNWDGDRTRCSIARSSNAQQPDQVPTWELSRILNLGGSQAYLVQNSPNPDGLLGQFWIKADASSGPTHGNVYVLCSVNPPGNDPLDVMFSRSGDGGDTWSPPQKINEEPPGANAWQWFATMDVAPTGRIDVVWFDTLRQPGTQFSQLRYSFSTDGGRVWSPSVAVSPAFDSWLGWPRQNKLGDYIDMHSDRLGASVAYAATFNGEQDIYYLRIGPEDCNGNGLPDDAEILAEESADLNHNGVPDECECLGDANDDLVVDQSDLDVVLFNLGSSVPAGTAGDIDADGAVTQADLDIVLFAFGRACR